MGEREMAYTALVLSEASRHLLLDKFQTLAVPFAHHMTVMMGTKLEDLSRKTPFFQPEDVGKTFQLQVTGIGRSSSIEAVVVSLVNHDNGLGITQNMTPHVTVATDGATKPFKSNELLKSGFHPIKDGMILNAVLQIVQD